MLGLSFVSCRHRIRHTVVLDDPFEDASEMQDLIPEGSPEPEFGQVCVTDLGIALDGSVSV